MVSLLPRARVFRPRVILDPERIQSQLEYCAGRGWTILIEHIHRDSFTEPFWGCWATPVCETGEGKQVLHALSNCCRPLLNHFVRCTAHEGDRMNAPLDLTMLIQAPGSAFSGSRGQSVGEEKTNTAFQLTVLMRLKQPFVRAMGL